MDDQEQLLRALISNSLDRVQIKFYLNTFRAEFEDDAPSSHLKCLLQLLVIENLKRQADPSNWKEKLQISCLFTVVVRRNYTSVV